MCGYIVVFCLFLVQDVLSSTDCILPAQQQQQVDKLSNWLVNMAEHLAAKETDFFQELVESKPESGTFGGVVSQ